MLDRIVSLFTLEDIARALTSPWGIATMCLGIVAFAATALIRLYRKTVPLARSLSEITARVTEHETPASFAENFNEITEALSRSAILGSLWSEFVETLVLPRPDQTRQVIRNTEDAAAHFNLSTIVEDRINLRTYREVSNYLPALGILGTFLGLTAGIILARGGLTTNDTELMRSSLNQLLSGASLAFLTSIAGLFSSFPYSIAEKKLDHKLQVAIGHLCHSLDERLEKVTPEQLATDQLQELKDQTHQLERFNTDLAYSISTALDERLEQRFTPLLQKTLDALEGIRQDQQTASSDLIQKMVDEFRTIFTGAAGSEMNAMAATMDQLTKKLEVAADSISGAGSQVGKDFEAATRAASEQIHQTLEELTLTLSIRQEQSEEAFRNAASGLGLQVEAMAGNLRSSGEEAGAGLAKAASQMTDDVSRASENMAIAAAKITDGIQKSVEQFRGSLERQGETAVLVEDLTRSITLMLTQLKGNIKELRGVQTSLERIAAPLGQAGDGLVQTTAAQERLLKRTEELQAGTAALAASVDTAAESLKVTWESVHERFAEIDKALADAFIEVNSGLETHTAGVRTFLSELDKSLSNAVKMLSGAIDELSGAIEDMPKPGQGGGK